MTLALIAGRVYSKTVSLIRKTHEKKGFWLSIDAVKKYLRLKHYPLHSQTIQALIESYFDNLKSYFRQSNDEKHPPFRTPKYHSIPFKKSAIKVKEGKIHLSLGKSRTPLVFNFPKQPKQKIRYAEICWDNILRQYYLILTVQMDAVKETRYKKVVSIDLGEIHSITFTDGETITVIYNGRLIRSIKQYREKIKATFAELLSRCKKYSRRWWKLTKSKNRQLRNLNARIKDAIHKITRHFANWCKSNRVGTVVIGKLTGIRDNIDYGKKINQKVHQWAFAEFTRQLKYKLQEFGIKVVEQDESYTSKTCPNCGKKNYPNNRNYECSKCRFVYHRDGVGCLNILDKYRGTGAFSSQQMLFPRSRGGWQPPQVKGVRFNFNLCNPISVGYGLFG